MENAHKIGKEKGNQLIFSDNFLNKEYSEIYQDNIEEIVDLEKNILMLNKNIESKNSQLNFLIQEIEVNDEKYNILNAKKKDSPGLFDGFKGWLFMVLSVLLLISDYFILGKVLSQVLGAKFMNDSGELTFTGSLIFLTTCILTMGMIIKVFLDKDLFENKKFHRIIDVGAIIALLIVFVTASVRFFISFEIGNETISKFDFAHRMLSFFLGVSLPIIGAIYFIYSYTLIKNSFFIKRVKKKIVAVRNKIFDLNKRKEKDEMELKMKTEKLKYNKDVLNSKRNKLKSAYFQGVEEGLLSAFKSADYIEELKKAIVREKINNYNAKKFI